jgi:hypothetical protein
MSVYRWLHPETWELIRACTLAFGVLVAVVSVLEARRVARKKQTADTLLYSRSNEQVTAGLRFIREVHESPQKNMRALADDMAANAEELGRMIVVLNFYETVAVGIREGIYDEAMWKRAQHRQIVVLWQRVEQLVKNLRTKQSHLTLYQELEILAKRWEGKPLKVECRASV